MPDQPTTESFPHQRARTRVFTAGAPRSFQVDPTGSRVTFLRSRSGDDPLDCLWCYDVDTAEETLLADPRAFLGPGGDQLPAAERARRERAREARSGIVAFAMDRSHSLAAFALSGRLFIAEAATAALVELNTAGPVVDPRPDPTGQRVAYVTGRTLHVIDRSGADRELAADDSDTVTWGLAEYIAAEEIGRFRGFWWAPDGRRLVAARVDEAAVPEWHISDPAHPAKPASPVRYPAAGAANADVGLAILDLEGGRTDIEWDRAGFPYVVDVRWDGSGLLLVVQTRDQRTVRALEVDPETGATSPLHESTDPTWVDLVAGVPARLDDGRLVTTVDADDTRRLCIDGTVVTPVGLQVLSVSVRGGEVLVTATEDPTERHVYRARGDGSLERLTEAPGVHAAVSGGGVVVVAAASMDRHGTRVSVHRGDKVIGTITSYAETPSITPAVTFLASPGRQIRAGVTLPAGHERGQSLPVLLDPYGGPHAARVLRSRTAYLVSQWFADQGFAVVVADGRGTPARGPGWERAIRHDWAGAVVEDQIEALHAAAEMVPDLDLSRVGIRGWSFGGYLAALSVLRRPDVFHAAVAGAPVTDWSLYDTHYTERYLGTPQDNPDAYAATSLIDDAPKLRRPLLLVHGLADDNVVAAHTLRLSTALLAAGRPHAVLPLTEVTHMTTRPVVEENLLLLQVDFLKTALQSRGPKS